MAIEKNSVKHCELSTRSRETMSSQDDELMRRNSAVESDDDDEIADYDSGAGSDDFDLLELGEAGEEFCQVGDETCGFPIALYDLPGLEDILSVEVWNEILTEEDRFSLTKYLPDMDNETYMQTMKELFTGINFHFGTPISKLFEMMKGGLCEPRVALYRHGYNFFQRRIHHHLLRNYHNQMVSNLHEMRDTWVNCKGYDIQEKLHMLTMKNHQKNLFHGNKGELRFDSNGGYEFQEDMWRRKRVKNLNETPPITKRDLLASSSSRSIYAQQNKTEGYGYGSGLAHDDDEFPVHLNNNMPFQGGKRGKKTANQLSDAKVITSKAYEFGKRVKYTEKTGLKELSDVVAAEQLLLHGRNKLAFEEEPSSRRRRDSIGMKRGGRMLKRNDETESDSSEKIYEDEDEDGHHLMAYPSSVKTGPKKTKVHVGPNPWRKMNHLAAQIEDKYVMRLNNYHEPENEAELYKERHRLNDYSSPLSSYNHEYDTDKAIDDHHEVLRRRKAPEDLEMMTPDAVTPNLETEPGLVMEEMETKPQKKPFILITPTVHTGFSFSIIHLLSAVRTAMTNPISEDLVDNVDKVENSTPANAPLLRSQEVVNCVKSNPGDPSILEAREPLQDLVRGVLRIFSSKTAPLGAKGWKPLVVYERSSRTWSWIGPLVYNLSDPDAIEEVTSTSPEAWSLPRKMLVKLVDAFANWLKSGQETFQQMGSLPAPPLAIMQANLDEKERFRDLRAQRSLTTINPSVDEIRDYFRKEEILRYSIPDRAFSYTAIDGRKTIVAPLRRCGGKPTSKARDHFMLKRDRPPHVTILCLVRDAASRLPGNIGTRADVCILIRDSQYIVEDVSDAQVNQVVSGALDRLHYERDPCVLFDSERKLWVYLHKDREEEDFEDDGTSSMKKWKRPKKDGANDETFEHEMVTAGGEEQEQEHEHEQEGGGLDVVSDPNIAENSHEGGDEVSPTGLNSFGFDSTHGISALLLGQENTANGGFDDKHIWEKTTE